MKCTLCWLHKTVNTVCMSAQPNIHAPLQIFVDSPSPQDDVIGEYGSSMVSRLMIWMLEKWSLTPDDAGINFAIKCSAGKSLKKKIDKIESVETCARYTDKFIDQAKALIGFGELSSFRLLGVNRPLTRTVYQEHKRKDKCSIFISYSPGYLIQKPSETVDALRILHEAAVSAGLSPVLNRELPLFDFGVI